jgi:hypothetical protein
MSKVTEEKLLKALNELEESVIKGGDALVSADTEGGLSTEGTPLSSKQSKSSGETVKAVDEKEKDKVSKGTKKKGMPPVTSEEDESSDDAGDDDQSEEDDDDDEGDKTEKSLKDRAAEEPNVAKAVEVSDFLEGLVETLDTSLKDMSKSLRKSITEDLGGELRKSVEAQLEFNSKLATAVVSIGKEVREQGEMIKSLAGQPNVPQRRAVLSKSEIVQPGLGGGEGEGLATLPKERITNWLMEKAMRSEIDPVMVTAFEQSGNIAALPHNIQKALTNDLVK